MKCFYKNKGFYIRGLEKASRIIIFFMVALFATLSGGAADLGLQSNDVEKHTRSEQIALSYMLVQKPYEQPPESNSPVMSSYFVYTSGTYYESIQTQSTSEALMPSEINNALEINKAKEENPVKLPPSDSEKIVYLSFDDGPCLEGDSPTQNTAAILDILAEYDIKATFFVMGAHANMFPDLILREFNEGHVIGNHTYSHVDPRKTETGIFIAQVRSTNYVIKNITGVKPTLFRSPYGAPLSREQYKGIGMKLCNWDLDTRDWAKTSVEEILEKVKKAAEKGINEMRIIFHDRHAQGLELVINALISYGYRFDTLDHWPAK